MATQGIVSIVDGDKVLLKVVAGCDGYNAKTLARRLFEMWPISPTAAYGLAEEVGFGCDHCRFVITEYSILGLNDTHQVRNVEEDKDEDFSLYRETFQKPRFNPRWPSGTADYIEVVYIPKNEIQEPARYPEGDWVCQIRPSTSYTGGNLVSKDFFRPEKVTYLTFEEGIRVVMYSPHSNTIIVENRGFCVVKKPFTPKPRTKVDFRGGTRTYIPKDPNILCVCLPERVRGREVVFYSPTINPLTIR